MNNLLQNLKEKVMDSIDDTYSRLFYQVIEEDEDLAEDIKSEFNALLEEVKNLFDTAKQTKNQNVFHSNECLPLLQKHTDPNPLYIEQAPQAA